MSLNYVRWMDERNKIQTWDELEEKPIVLRDIGLKEKQGTEIYADELNKMAKCAMCEETAKYRSNRVMNKMKGVYTPYYCEQHKREGLVWGWLEDEELKLLE